MPKIVVSYFTYSDKYSHTTIYANPEEAFTRGYRLLGGRPAGDCFYAYPLHNEHNQLWKGCRSDLETESLQDLIEKARTLWSKDRYDGSCCPRCTSTSIESPSMPDYDDGRVYWPMRCTACQAHWDEVLILSHYTNLEPGDPPSKQ